MPEALRDIFYTRRFFDALIDAIRQPYPTFDQEVFFTELYSAVWDNLTLMQRMRHTVAALRAVLPSDYREALGILCAAAPALQAYTFEGICLAEFVALYGLDDWDASLPALETFTQVASAEFAVRPFIVQDTPRMMTQMLRWTTHSQETVRRLASEGCRPRLPWGMALRAFKQNPAPILPILEALKDDPSETVRRSVANNLNDIAKDHPEIVTELLNRWKPNASEARQWIIRHALRTLIKAGDDQALNLLGYEQGAQVTVNAFTISAAQVNMGDALSFEAQILSTSDDTQRLVIDYVVYYRKANGTCVPKVFKLTETEIAPGAALRVKRQISFRPLTTRVYYPGEHTVALKINGEEVQGPSFMVLEALDESG